jgi:single-stranded-DNA-specific exonuclease
MNYRWTLRPLADEAAVARLAHELNDLPEALARALAVRGIDSFDGARGFFRAGLEAAHDPFLMRDMDLAASRVAAAISGGEKVMVYGDYDVDGTTATAIMTHFLRARGVDASYFIPNRFEHGYGLCEAGLDQAVASGASLVIALDCGITAVEEARYAKSIDVDLIIADHHEPGPELPEAVAVLDPKRADCSYPFAGLSGCGVGFKLIQATLHELGRPPEEAHPYLDLLAVSIAADIVPVLDENRVLMRAGLERLAQAPRVGLQALAEVAGADLSTADSSTIVFHLGPRINAAGRLDSADRAVELFLCEEPATALRLARELDDINRERRDLDSRTFAQALAQAALQITSDPAALVLFHDDWHPGVIGIVASRVAEHYHRPTIMLAGRGDVIKGSARSVDGVSIHQALSTCEDLLTTFGGHDAAAGLALERENLEAFRAALHQAVGHVVGPDGRQPEIVLDAPLDLTLLASGCSGRFWAVLQQFGPFGPDNPRPLFWGRDLQLAGRPSAVGRENRHLRLAVRQRGDDQVYKVIGFGLGDRLALLQNGASEIPLEMAFCVSENRWNGRVSIQLEAKDVRLAEAATTN